METPISIVTVSDIFRVIDLIVESIFLFIYLTKRFLNEDAFTFSNFEVFNDFKAHCNESTRFKIISQSISNVNCSLRRL